MMFCNRIIRYIFVVLLCVFVSNINIVLGASMNYEHEASVLAGVRSCDTHGIYCIHIFDGYMAIPKRYVLNSTSSNVIELNSFNSDLRNIVPAGFIRIGGSGDQMNAILEPYAKRKREIVRYGGFTVYLYEGPKDYPELKNNVAAFITQGNHFLLVSDPNRELWRALVTNYLNINGY